MKKSAIILAAAIMVLPLSSYSSQPDSNERNIKFSVDIHDMPRKIGDLLRFSWSFTLKELEDTLLQRYFDEIDDPLIGKVYFTVYPHQEFISGDSVWWGELEYDKTYSFTATYKIISESRIIGTPVVDICREMSKDERENRRSQNTAKGFLFDIEGWNKREEPKLGFVAYGDDTVFVRTLDPIDDSAISNVIRKINPNTVQKTAAFLHF